MGKHSEILFVELCTDCLVRAWLSWGGGKKQHCIECKGICMRGDLLCCILLTRTVSHSPAVRLTEMDQGAAV